MSVDASTAYARTHTVHTGTDIYVVFSDMVMTTCQGISYSVTRQKAPVYVLGSVDPKSVARSKRGIAGSMIMTTFDRHSLGEFMQKQKFNAKVGSLATTDANPYKKDGTPTADDVDSAIEKGLKQEDASLIDANADAVIPMQVVPPMFSDEILPFDTTLAAKNEYGSGSSMRIFGVEVLNEGSGVSIDDTSNEVQFTYIARLITPWMTEPPVEIVS